jgi:hypothetical protein
MDMRHRGSLAKPKYVVELVLDDQVIPVGAPLDDFASAEGAYKIAASNNPGVRVVLRRDVWIVRQSDRGLAPKVS